MARLETIDGVLCLDGRPVIRAWESFSGWYWFAIEEVRKQISVINGRKVRDTIYFGLVQGGFEDELGYFSLAELESLKPRVWELPKRAFPWSGRRRPR